MKNRFLIVLTVVLGLSLSSSQSAAQNRVLGLHETLSNENAEAIAAAMATLDEWIAAMNTGMIAYMADPASPGSKHESLGCMEQLSSCQIGQR